MNNSTQLKILLLEDQGITRAGIRGLIQIAQPRAEIHEASTYDEATDLLEKTSFEFAFLDHDLKGEKTGRDVLTFIREKELSTLAIMLSSREDRSLVMACLEAGASGYIPKGMDAEGVFEDALKAIFKGQTFLPNGILGKGGFSPVTSTSSPRATPEALGITGRRLEVLYYLTCGYRDKDIARRMGISDKTVTKDYNPPIFRALGVARRVDVVLEVARRGLIVPAPGNGTAPLP